MAVEVKDAPKAEAKKSNVATTRVEVGESPNFKVFQKGQEVTGIDKKEMDYLKENGFVKEA